MLAFRLSSADLASVHTVVLKWSRPLGKNLVGLNKKYPIIIKYPKKVFSGSLITRNDTDGNRKSTMSMQDDRDVLNEEFVLLQFTAFWHSNPCSFFYFFESLII